MSLCFLKSCKKDTHKEMLWRDREKIVYTLRNSCHYQKLEVSPGLGPSLVPLKGVWSCQQLDFGLQVSRTVRQWIPLFLNYPVSGILLCPPQESNTPTAKLPFPETFHRSKKWEPFHPPPLCCIPHPHQGPGKGRPKQEVLCSISMNRNWIMSHVIFCI